MVHLDRQRRHVGDEAIVSNMGGSAVEVRGLPGLVVGYDSGSRFADTGEFVGYRYRAALAMASSVENGRCKWIWSQYHFNTCAAPPL